MPVKSYQQVPLAIELVPEPCWYSNLRKVLPRTEWDRIRKATYAAYGNRCGVCQADAPLHCHERWAYDDDQHVQSLLGFIALCETCHHVKHLGLAQILANEGKLDIEAVIAHYQRVNQCDRVAFAAHRAEAFAHWRERGQHPWQTELGDYATLIPSR